MDALLRDVGAIRAGSTRLVSGEALEVGHDRKRPVKRTDVPERRYVSRRIVPPHDDLAGRCMRGVASRDSARVDIPYPVSGRVVGIHFLKRRNGNHVIAETKPCGGGEGTRGEGGQAVRVSTGTRQQPKASASGGTSLLTDSEGLGGLVKGMVA